MLTKVVGILLLSVETGSCWREKSRLATDLSMHLFSIVLFTGNNTVLNEQIFKIKEILFKQRCAETKLAQKINFCCLNSCGCVSYLFVFNSFWTSQRPLNGLGETSVLTPDLVRPPWLGPAPALCHLAAHGARWLRADWQSSLPGSPPGLYSTCPSSA